MYVSKKYRQFLTTRQGKRVVVIPIVFVASFFTHLFAMENNGRGTQAIGMANAFVAVSDNPWAINYNPAGLSQIKDIQCSAFIVPEQFGLPELRTTAISVALPTSYAAIGMKIDKFGFNLYSETEWSAAAGIKMNKNISLGICINYHRLDIERYGRAQNVSVDGGILTHVLESASIGFCISNITGSSRGLQKEKIPQTCELGACWCPINSCQLAIELEKDIRYPVSIKFGVEQVILSAVAFRAGVANNPDKYSTGIGARYSFFEFGYAGYSHSDLGWTHQIDITIRID